MSKEFYVYILFREWNGEPCYVGKGHGKRYEVHRRQGARHRNKHLANILKRTLGELPIVIVRDNLNEAEAFETEIALIAAIGRADLKLGPLANHTNGGEGTKNLSEDVKLRKSLASKAHWTLEKRVAVSSRFKDKPLSDGHRISISIALKGRTDGNRIGREASPIAKLGVPLAREIVEKMRASKIGVPQSRDHIEKRSNARRGIPLSDNHRGAISAGLKGLSKSEAHRMALAASDCGKSTRGTRWWMSQSGESYRAVAPRHFNDEAGRKLKFK